MVHLSSDSQLDVTEIDVVSAAMVLVDLSIGECGGDVLMSKSQELQGHVLFVLSYVETS